MGCLGGFGVCSIDVGSVMKEVLSQGLDAWIWQRVTSLFLVLYFLPILIFWVLPSANVVAVWQPFLFAPSMRILGGLASISILIHACIGIWVVATDYVQIDLYQQLVLSFFYLLTFLSSILMLVALWA